MIFENIHLACYTNGTDTVSALNEYDATVVLKEIYGEDTSVIDQISAVPPDKMISVWIDGPGDDASACKCAGIERVSPRKTPNGHHPDCEVGHPRKTASEWAREGRGLVCSTEY